MLLNKYRAESLQPCTLYYYLEFNIKRLIKSKFHINTMLIT
jgi:hypothetical protein